MKKIITCSLVLALVLAIFPVFQVEAAPKYTGTYYKKYKTGEKLTAQPMYSVTINKIKNKKIKFQVAYFGRNASPFYETNIITAKLKNKTASFKWKDSWGNSGTGKLKLGKGYVKIKMKQTKNSKWNRATLDTQKKYLKIRKKNNNKKVSSWE